MAGLESNLYVSTAITWVAAAVALGMRIVARRMMKISWWFDDWCCILAFIFASCYSATILQWTMHWSLGQYMPDDISASHRERILYNSRLLGFLNSLSYAFSIAASKLAVLFLYWRIFSISTIRIPIQVMIALCVMWIILRTFMLIFRCVPVQAYWDKTIPDAKCRIKDTDFFFSTVLTHFLMDIAILVLPIFEVFRLRLRLGQKLAIAALFIVGIIVCLASVGAIVEALTYDSNTTQMPHDYGMYCVWGTVEINIAIVSACFPLLRPIFSRILPARFLSTSDKSSRPTNAIRLTTMSRATREKGHDETSSMRELADPENSVSGHSDSEMGPSSGGIHTVISSRYARSGSYDGEGGEGRRGEGIHVDYDTVQVEETLAKAYGR